MRRILLLLVLGCVLLVLGGGYYGYTELQKTVNTPLTLSEASYFTLPNGANRNVFEKLLEQQQLIKLNQWVKAVIWVEFKVHQIKAGTYNLTPKMTLNDLLALMISGKEAQFSVQFIDGTNFQTWLKVLSQAKYLKHTLSHVSEQKLSVELGLQQYPSLEGLFYPDTYYYTAGTTDVSILKRAASKMQTLLQHTWQTRANGLPYQTPYQMLILASMIEKETGVAQEKPIVASVFINRLNQGIRLQSDPTVIYGMGQAYQGKITTKDLKTYTPYNTYVIKGLPPTPISSVDEATLQAAAHPANTPYLYFVANGDGEHIFSKTLKQHDKAVSAYISTLEKQHNKK